MNSRLISLLRSFQCKNLRGIALLVQVMVLHSRGDIMDEGLFLLVLSLHADVMRRFFHLQAGAVVPSYSSISNDGAALCMILICRHAQINTTL